MIDFYYYQFFSFTTGKIHAYWKYIFEITKEQQQEQQHNKATFDEKWFEKIERAALDPSNSFNPYSNIGHHVWAALEKIIYKSSTLGDANNQPPHQQGGRL